MPEGDTLYKIAQKLQPALEGFVPHEVRLARRRATSLEKRIGRVEAVGKHLLIEFDDGEVLRTHLGMHGSWRLFDVNQPLKKWSLSASVELWVEDQVAVCFNAKEVEFLHRRSLRTHVRLARLGPDILGAININDVVLRAREHRNESALLVDVLLDQRITCGIGNVYKNEALFLQQLKPNQRLGATDDRALASLFGCAKELMERNLEPGPRVTTGTRGQLPNNFVYGRAQRPCLKCSTSIKYQRLGERPRDTYWCPGCQR